MPGTEFIGRFLQHILPAGFKRIRHYGLLSAARKKIGLAAARPVLGVPPPEPAVIKSVADFRRRVARIEHQRCLSFGVGKLQVVATLLLERHYERSGSPIGRGFFGRPGLPWTGSSALPGIDGGRSSASSLAAGSGRIMPND